MRTMDKQLAQKLRLLRMIESEAQTFDDMNAFAGWITSITKTGGDALSLLSTEALEKLYHDIGVELRERDEKAA